MQKYRKSCLKNITYRKEIQLTDYIKLIEICENGKTLNFLNGTLLTTSKNRFIIVPDPLHHQYHLVIEDYAWWHDNHYDVTDWMREHLPRGEEHQKGMMLSFDTEEQRTWFLLRWQ